jgi:hypothetical protein
MDIIKGLRLRILISYWYYKDTDIDALVQKYFPDNPPEIFADSGAFSAMTQGGKVNLREYAQWLKKWKHHFSTYANLDVIKDPIHTWENQLKLEDLDLSPLPVFHVLEDWEYLERYIENYSYIALGVAGMQQRKKAIMGWITQCFKRAGDTCVFHGFGLTSLEVIKTFPWYSVDSSSWGAGFRFGIVPLFHDGKLLKAKLGSTDWFKYSSIVRSYGFDPMDFADRKKNDRKKICALSALSYMHLEKYLQQRHGIITIPGQEDGCKVHLVAAQSNGDDQRGSNMGFRNLSESLGGKVFLVDSTAEKSMDIGLMYPHIKGAIDGQEDSSQD